MPRYEVAGLIINIESKDTLQLDEMREYTITEKRETDLNYKFLKSDFIDKPAGEIISDEGTSLYWIRKQSDQKGYYVYTCTHGAVGKILVLMDTSSDWQNAVITWADIQGENDIEHNYIQTRRKSVVHIFLGVVFRYHLLNYQGLVIHASTIKWNNKGIMFTAPSGTGKSTQVKLWQEHVKDVIVLNDDNPAVRIIDNKPIVFGTPWSGSSYINTNDSAPLTSIIIVKQAPQNTLRRLSIQEAMLHFLPRVFLPYFDQNQMIKAMDIYEKIIAHVPVYLLQCRPDKEAVELVYECLK